jgi:hypothetical protein
MRPTKGATVNARVSAAALAAAAIATLSACSAGSKSVGAPTTPTNTEVAAVAGSATQSAVSISASPTAQSIDICTVMPIAQAASLSGVTLATNREQDDAEGNAYTCDYFPASGSGGFSVTVQTVGGAQAYANSLQTDTIAGAVEHVAPVTGVGDKAFSARDGVRAVFGDRMIYVAGLASDPPAVAIIQALQAKLG